MNVHENTLRGLKEALEYIKGDETKARSRIVEIPDDEIEINQLIFKKFEVLSKENKYKTINYMNELMGASNG